MRRFSLVGAALVAALIAAATPARALKTETLTAPGLSPAAASSEYRVTSGQALVRLSTGTSLADLDAPLAAIGVTRLSNLGSSWLLVGWKDSVSVSFRLGQLKTVPGVADAQPSRVYSLHEIPNDPLVTLQYALAKVDAFRAWEFETGGSSRVTIAIVDSGVDGGHADLSGKFGLTTSVAFDPNSGAVASPNDPLTPACEHATEVAGVAAASANNSLDIAGMSWGAQIVSYKVFLDADCNSTCCSPGGDCSASGNTCITNDPGIIAAINQAVSVQNTAAYGHMVVNLSLGGTPTSTCAADSPALQTAITNAVSAGVVIVAAAGNDSGPVNSPGYCTGVIPAGATDGGDNLAYFSSRGAPLATNGLVAPGVSVVTTHPGNGTSSPSGTSFSSPMVAGTAALLLSAKPTLTPAQVQTNLRAGADNLGLPSTQQGAGRLNAYKSVFLTVNGTLPTPNGVNADAKPFVFPNPVRLSQTSGVEFSIPPSLGTSGLDIKIYTMTGRFVRDISAALWDGKNTDGNLVASGSYMFVVKTSAGSSSGRLAVIR